MARGKKAAADAAPVDEPWELPEGWRWERLGDLVTKSSAKHQPDRNSTLPFVGLEHIPSHEMRLSGVGAFAEMRSSGSAFEHGDVLYSRLRPYLNKVWVADRVGACSGELLVLRPHSGVNARYLALQLHGQRYLSYASNVVTGDRPRIDFDLVGAFLVPIPDTRTQDAIVKRIGAMFAEIDEGEAALAEARAGVATYRNSLLNAAVTGELTARWRRQNPPRETGAELLRRILAERRARWDDDPKNARKSYMEPTGPDTDGLPELPENWTWASLGQLMVDSPQNGAYFPASQYGPGAPIVRIDDFQAGKAKPAKFLRQVSVAPEIAALYRLDEGDLVINRVNSPSHLGKSFFVGNEQAGAMFESNMMRVKVTPTIRLAYLGFYLLSDMGRALLTRNAKAAVNQSSINQGDVSALAVPLPPGSEQRAVECAIQNAMADAEQGSAAVLQGSDMALILRQSILAAAFRGELTL